MVEQRTKAELYLEGKDVGEVVVKGKNGAWRFGEFVPGEGFAEFAMAFGVWSMFMHTSEGEPMTDEAREELRRVEHRIDGLKARVYFPGKDEWRRVVQLNIDGGLIEWKEG